MKIGFEVYADAHTASLVQKYRHDERLIESATRAFTNVLEVHDRAHLSTHDNFDMLTEIRAVAASSTDAIKQVIAKRDDEFLRDVRECVRDSAGAVVPEAIANSMRANDAAPNPNTGITLATLKSELEACSASTRASAAARADGLENALNVVLTKVEAARAETSELRRRSDAAAARNSNSSFRGRDGENMLTEVLCDRLMRSDGWSVRDVHAEAHACDMVVTREGCAPVRIECKRKKHITRHDVDKFHGDLRSHGDHGLMVSLEGAHAPGHTRGFSFERLGTDAGVRWAGIVVVAQGVAGTNADGSTGAKKTDPDATDVDHIVAAIRVIQCFAALSDENCDSLARDKEHMVFGVQDVERFNDEIKSTLDGVNSARGRLKAGIAENKAALACLEKITLNAIKSALAGCRSDSVDVACSNLRKR